MSVLDEIRQEQKKMVDKPFKEKLKYFWYYYKIPTIVILIVIIFGAGMIKDLVTAKDSAFTAFLLNSYGQYTQSDFTSEFTEYAAIDTENYECMLDATSTLSYDTMTDADLATSQKIMAMTYSQAIDVIVSDNEPFTNYAMNSMFADLREELTPEEYAKFEPYFYYVDQAKIQELENSELEYDENMTAQIVDPSVDHSDPSSMTDPVPVGIYLPNSAKLKQWELYTYSDEAPIFGIMVNSVHRELCHTFLQYLTEE